MTTHNPLSLTQRRMPNKQMLTNLSRFQRLLLVTDGTVTDMLEQYLEEKIKVNKLHEKIEQSRQKLFSHHQQWLTQNDMPVMQREILLQGQSSLNNWVHAESSIVINHLAQGFRTDLLQSKEPIGCLWEKYQVETFKSILDFEQREACDLAQHFNISPQEQVISRTYNVLSGGVLIMIITETFPTSFFNENNP